MIYIVDLYLTLLLSLADMDRMDFSLNNIRNLLMKEKTGLTEPIIRQYGHSFIRW